MELTRSFYNNIMTAKEEELTETDVGQECGIVYGHNYLYVCIRA